MMFVIIFHEKKFAKDFDEKITTTKDFDEMTTKNIFNDFIADVIEDVIDVDFLT